MPYNLRVNSATVTQLLRINRLFYQTLADHFARTRKRIQPGVHRILEELSFTNNLLDLGCGNGELARAWARNQRPGVYIGTDGSNELLDLARQRTPVQSNITFRYADLAQPDWDQELTASLPPSLLPIRTISAFAVLHHIPGQALRREVLVKIRELLHPQGLFIHSEWQFLNSIRLRQRIQPWERVNLSAGEVDPGDYLLDWRHGEFGLRYVHQFSESELVQLAAETGFEIQRTFYSDGEGGQLGLYQYWTRL